MVASLPQTFLVAALGPARQPLNLPNHLSDLHSHTELCASPVLPLADMALASPCFFSAFCKMGPDRPCAHVESN